jgi:hypothetical protein
MPAVLFYEHNPTRFAAHIVNIKAIFPAQEAFSVHLFIQNGCFSMRLGSFRLNETLYILTSSLDFTPHTHKQNVSAKPVRHQVSKALNSSISSA